MMPMLPGSAHMSVGLCSLSRSDATKRRGNTTMLTDDTREQLLARFPFLHEIVAAQDSTLPLFNIDVRDGRIDDGLKQAKCRDFDQSSGYQESSYWYAVTGGTPHVLVGTTVGAALDQLPAKPDYLVMVYFVSKRHDWSDYELHVYEM
jgi:hypothetical protein